MGFVRTPNTNAKASKLTIPSLNLDTAIVDANVVNALYELAFVLWLILVMTLGQS